MTGKLLSCIYALVHSDMIQNFQLKGGEHA